MSEISNRSQSTYSPNTNDSPDGIRMLRIKLRRRATAPVEAAAAIAGGLMTGTAKLTPSRS